jgi:hypothetical protein
MREKDVEKHLCDQVKLRGGKPYKFSSPGRRSVPDRLCCFRNNFHIFIECKAEGKRLSPAQIRECNTLVRLGHTVRVTSSKEETLFIMDLDLN